MDPRESMILGFIGRLTAVVLDFIEKKRQPWEHRAKKRKIL